MDHLTRIPGMDTGGHAQQQAPFFKLPLELRSKIYKEIIDATMHSGPPRNFPYSDYYHREQLIEQSIALEGGIGFDRFQMNSKHPKQYMYPTRELLLVCKRTALDLEYIVASRKAAGQPTARIDVLTLDDALWVSRVVILPHCSLQGHNVAVHITVSCFVTDHSWARVCETIVEAFWEDRLMTWGPMLDQRKIHLANRILDNVTVHVRHCMDSCKELGKYKDYYEKHGTPADSESESKSESQSESQSESEESVESELSRQSKESEKPICAHILQLISQMRSASHSMENGHITFVVAGQSHEEVSDSCVVEETKQT